MMDNHHVHISSTTMSCGVLELSGLTSDPRKVLYAIATHLYHPSRGSPAAIIVWSDLAHKGSNGDSLAEYIRNTLHDGHSLACTASIENPKTSNAIRMWTYVISHDKFKEWYRNERVARARGV